MKNGLKFLTIGSFLLFVWFLGLFFLSMNVLDLFNPAVFLTVFMILLASGKGYYNVGFYLAFLVLIFFQGLILTYTYLFTHFSLNNLFYSDLSIFILFIIIFSYMLINKQKLSKKRFKEE
jgi:hypothetical protein